MCGRYSQTHPREAIVKAFDLPIGDAQAVPAPTPRYNIAPSQVIGAIAQPGDHRQYRLFQWGLVPSWSKDPAIGHRLINARAETVAEKPSFRAAFKRRRCLIVADGFYEWQRLGSHKQPYFIHLTCDRNEASDAGAKTVGERPLFGFAGLWEQWEGSDGSYLETCTILTTEPNSLMAPIHNRMPVIIAPQDYDRWLDPSLQEGRHLQPLLRPYPAEQMQAYAVSPAVNNPRNDSPECVLPVATA